MATVHPPLHTIQALSKGQQVELKVLSQLAAGLPDTFELFHSVDWTQVRPEGDAFGEIDIIVLNQSGDLAMLEVKAGEVQFAAAGIFKRYGIKNKNVSSQVNWQFSGIQGRLRSAGLQIRLMNFLVLPDVTVGRDTATVGFDRARILDALDCQFLAETILAKVGSGQQSAACEQVRAFLLNELQCKVDVATMAGQVQSWTHHLAGGMAEWVPKLQVPSRILRVRGTAGSGKTQLALTLLRRAATSGRKAAYVCFNRPLADHMRQIAPPGTEVRTFHQLCWAVSTQAPGSTPPELTNEGYQQSAARYSEHVAQTGPDLDLLVVDELQDLDADWLQTLAARVRVLGTEETPSTTSHPQDGLVLLDDPDQSLYADRAELDLPEAVVLTCHDNYRSPRQVTQVVNALQLTRQPVQARSPHEGSLPVFRTWPAGNADTLCKRTQEAVQACLNAGFALHHICVLTWRGSDHSALLKASQLGDWKLVRDARLFDHQHHPERGAGDLRIETLRRFKGQSAPAIVFTEIDEESWGDLERHKLFVGMTRATLHLEVVLSERAERFVMQAL